MQPRPTQHIIDAINETSLCGKTAEHGRWFDNPKLLTSRSFRATDCEVCAKQAVALGIWKLPVKNEPPVRHRFRVVAAAQD